MYLVPTALAVPADRRGVVPALHLGQGELDCVPTERAHPGRSLSAFQSAPRKSSRCGQDGRAPGPEQRAVDGVAYGAQGEEQENAGGVKDEERQENGTQEHGGNRLHKRQILLFL